MSKIRDVIVQGLQKNSSALAQLLGLRPLLAVTSTAINILDLGPATMLMLTLTNLTISTLRHQTPVEIRTPIYVMITASMVSVVQTLINACVLSLYQSLGIFIPLVVISCIIMGRAETSAAEKGPVLSVPDSLSTGMGAVCATLVLGLLREVISSGTLFGGTDALLGNWTKVLRVEIFRTDSPFLLAVLPPGMFTGLGLTLAGEYLTDGKMKKRHVEIAAECALSNGETGNI